MKKMIAALGLVLAVSLSSCVAGPKQLARTVDDWDGKMYVENPWMDAVLNVIPVIPLAGAIGGFVDFFSDNLVAFWMHDAWDGKGTAFKHFEVTPTDGAAHSLLLDDGKFMEVK